MGDAVSHAEMVAAVRAIIADLLADATAYREVGRDLKAKTAENNAEILRAVLAVLERHERAMKVVDITRGWLEAERSHEEAAIRWGLMVEVRRALTALDAAGERETPA